MIFLNVYNQLYTRGYTSHPRGMRVIEIQDFMVTLPPYERFTSFNARKFNLDYAKFEMLWYFTADPHNDMILKSASMWDDLRQPDGRWFSNYGQYWFGSPQYGFDWVVGSLIKDKDTRQAVIPMLRHGHLFTSNKDVVCTQSISFRIRRNKLYMSVNMRSQDAVWGFTNDIFCFSVLHEMVYKTLLDTYDDLEMGTFTHKVDSFHVYERHFIMLEQILDEGEDGYYEVDCPRIYDKREVVNLIDFRPEDTDSINHKFTGWLNDNKYSKQVNDR